MGKTKSTTKNVQQTKGVCLLRAMKGKGEKSQMEMI